MLHHPKKKKKHPTEDEMWRYRQFLWNIRGRPIPPVEGEHSWMLALRLNLNRQWLRYELMCVRSGIPIHLPEWDTEHYLYPKAKEPEPWTLKAWEEHRHPEIGFYGPYADGSPQPRLWYE